MHCLLCHEKIPRLRAWTGKSEFCCDEHAELYKKQTMDRLLVDDSVTQSAPPALPILDVAASASLPVPASASVDHVLLKDQSNKAKQASQAEAREDLDELWKLAERMGPKEKPRSSSIQLPGISEPEVESQSAEDALAALQALAAEASTPDSLPGGDLLDEFSNLESTFDELPALEALPVDLDDEIGEAPEFELDALELVEEQSETASGPELVVQSVEPEDFDAPDLVLEGLAEAQPEALEPPDLAAEFAAEEPESLEPPDAGLDELLAEPKVAETPGAELAEPPEPEDFEVAAAEETAPILAAAPVARRAPKAAPKLRPSTELHEMSPSPAFPEDRYTLKPWSDALAVAGPDRVSLLGPMKLEMRKSSLNGTASAKFDPVVYRASERVASVAVSVMEPESSTESFSSQEHAFTPRAEIAWPMPLHAVLVAAEMNLCGTSRRAASGDDSFSVRQPTLSAEFLSSVALHSRIMEPRSSAILSPRERDGFASAAAEEEVSGSSASAGRSDRDETDGGERTNVADLF